jgi:hypothetical protein
MLIAEGTAPDGHLDSQKMEEITRREIEAGRMSSQTVCGKTLFAHLARSGSACRLLHERDSLGSSMAPRPRGLRIPSSVFEFATSDGRPSTRRPGPHRAPFRLGYSWAFVSMLLRVAVEKHELSKIDFEMIDDGSLASESWAENESIWTVAVQQ